LFLLNIFNVFLAILRWPMGIVMSRFNQYLTLFVLLLTFFWTSPAWATKVDLTELSLEQLFDVKIISASRYEQTQSEVAAAVSVITRSEIKAFGWRTLDEALVSLPGIHMTYDRQYNYLGTRGFGLPGDFTTRLLLTINGNRTNDVVYDSAYMGRTFPLDLDLIERIEFIPGPVGAVYGQNALFGVINVVTRDGAGVDGTELAVSYQDPQAVRQGRATWGKKLDNGIDLLLSASANKGSGEDLFFVYPRAGAGGADVSGMAIGMDGERDKDFFTHLARGLWSFDVFGGDSRKDDPTASYFAEPLMPGQYQRERFLLTQLHYQDRFADDTLDVSGRLFLGRTRYSGVFNYDTLRLSKGHGDWQGVEMHMLFKAMADHKLMVGLEYQDNSRQDQSDEDSADPSSKMDILGSGWRTGVFIQDEWTLSKILTATLGLRIDRNEGSEDKLSPRGGLIWQATSATILKTLYGRAHRAPNAYERDYHDDGYSQVANPSLKGEAIDTLELVADHRVSENLFLRGSLYHWRMQGLVTLGIDPVSGLSQYQSGDDVRANGVEFSADQKWGWGGRLRGSLSCQNVSYESGGDLDNSPQVLGKFNFSGPLPVTGLNFGSELQYFSKRQTVNGTDSDGYWLSNLNLSADQLAKGVEVSLGLYNLFDVRYDHPGSDINWQNVIEQDGMSLRLKVVYRF
jgi:iron complex outermembrane receptor protein